MTVNSGNVGFHHCIQMDTSVNSSNQVVSVGADIAFDAEPKFFACFVRFESSSVPTTLPTADDVDPLDGRLVKDWLRYESHVVHGRDALVDILKERGLLSEFFFFQAEDGIRDYKVTGVQTCALPICCRLHAARPWTRFRLEPIGSRRPSMAASSRRSPTAPTRNTGWTSPSCRADPTATTDRKSVV